MHVHYTRGENYCTWHNKNIPNGWKYTGYDIGVGTTWHKTEFFDGSGSEKELFDNLLKFYRGLLSKKIISAFQIVHGEDND